MILEEAFKGHLFANAAAQALICDRLYPQVIPEDATLPAASYQRITGPREEAHDGPTSWAEALVQFTCQAETYGQAKACANALRKAFVGFNGLLNGAVPVNGVWCENELDGVNDEVDRYTIRVDLFFYYQD